MAQRIKAMPLAWQQFLLSVLFLVIVPLAVVLLDAFIKKFIPNQDVYLTFAVYIVATGAASRSEAFMGSSFLLGCAYLIAYAMAAAIPDKCPPAAPEHGILGYLFIYVPVIIFTFICLAERYNRHVVDNELFWAFRNAEGT